MNKKNFIIRKASINDLDKIMNVEDNCFPEEDRYSRDKIKSRISGPPFSCAYERTYFVAEQNNKIVGYGEAAIQEPSIPIMDNFEPVSRLIGRIDNKVGVLISMGVLPESRGQGIGSSLISSRLNYLKEEGISQVFAHSWPNGGFPGLSKKFGFHKIDGWKGRCFSDGSTQELYFKEIRC